MLLIRNQHTPTDLKELIRLGQEEGINPLIEKAHKQETGEILQNRSTIMGQKRTSVTQTLYLYLYLELNLKVVFRWRSKTTILEPNPQRTCIANTPVYNRLKGKITTIIITLKKCLHTKQIITCKTTSTAKICLMPKLIWLDKDLREIEMATFCLALYKMEEARIFLHQIGEEVQAKRNKNAPLV